MLSFEASKFPELTDTNLAKIANLKAAYDDRRAYWKTTRLPQALKDELENDVIAKGDKFWDVMNREIIPALTAKDEDKAHVSSLLFRQLSNMVPAFVALARAKARLAMAVSWMPVPVRSAKVIWPSLVRPCTLPATIWRNFMEVPLISAIAVVLLL